MSARAARAVIEAAYRYGAPNDWLRGVAESSARALGYEEGALAVRYRVTPPDWIDVEHVELVGTTPQFARLIPERRAGTCRQLVDYLRKPRVGTLLTEPLTRDIYAADLRASGFSDVFAMSADDASGQRCSFYFPYRRSRPTPERTYIQKRVAAHIAAGYRLQHTLARIADARAPSPAGPAREARDALRDALVTLHRAQSRQVTPTQSMELWRGIVSGRWSIIERFERDGCQYYLAHRNDPQLERDLALTEREQQVLALADLGHSNKLIAYSLRLTRSTVSTLLKRARTKLCQSSLAPLRPEAGDARQDS